MRKTLVPALMVLVSLGLALLVLEIALPLAAYRYV